MPIVTPIDPVKSPSPVSGVEAIKQKLQAALDNKGAPKKEDEPLATASDAVAESESPKLDETPIAEDSLSSKFSALARREREITRRMQQFAAEKKAFEEERTKTQSAPRDPDTGKFISLEDLQKDPLGVLSKHGLSYESLTERALNPEATVYQKAIDELKAEVAALKGETGKVKEDFTARQKLEYDQAINQIRQDVSSVVAHAADYETIKESGSEEAVVRLIEQTFADTGSMLSIEDACAQVEEYLIEESLKVANYKKVKAKLLPPVTQETSAPNQGASKLAPQKQSLETANTNQLKTLTNAAMTAPTRPRTEAERRARALAVLRGEKLT